MWRNIACAAVLLGLSLGMAMAEEIKGRITKIDDKKVTVAGFKEKEGKEYNLADKVKIYKMTGFGKDKEPKKEEFSGGPTALAKEIGEKGLFGTIVVDDDS